MLAVTTKPDAIVFIIAGAMCLFGASGVILRNNPVHCALSLILTLFGIAVLFVAQSADFLAAVQIVVYAGAIVVLFLFVIMLIGVDREDKYGALSRKLKFGLGALVAIAVLVEIIAFGRSAWVTGLPKGGEPLSHANNIRDVAHSVFTDYVFPFELTSALLLISVLGAVVLARRSEPTERTESAINKEPVAT
jgi:NADH-quinone oxidoreductase subunit J